MSEETINRIARAQAVMAEKQLPALFITQMDNVAWISGFSGSSGYVLLTQTDAAFATDSRYYTQAAAECPGFRQVHLGSNGMDDLLQMVKDSGASRVGFEAGHMTYRGYQTYREKLPAEIEFVPTDRLIEDLRMVKDAGEIAHIEAACRLTDRAFENILPSLRPGNSERDVMLELEWFMRKEGGAEVAFDTIIASGPRSALPHGRASIRVMEPGDFVTLDFGARLGGYCSDITRTVVLGEPTQEQRKVYGIVRDALYRAIDAIKPGVVGKEVDAAARDLITAAGYGSNFGHGLGHSIGRTVHDGPGFAPRSEVMLEPGMIITVEPGIYIPDWGGVRIEHDVLVTTDGHRILSEAPTDLINTLAAVSSVSTEE